MRESMLTIGGGGALVLNIRLLVEPLSPDLFSGFPGSSLHLQMHALSEQKDFPAVCGETAHDEKAGFVSSISSSTFQMSRVFTMLRRGDYW